MVFDLPPIPFDVHDPNLGKTIHIVSSCDARPRSITLLVNETDQDIKRQVYVSIALAFRTNGVTIVEICRTK